MNDANADQRSYWSDEAGPTWAAQSQAMDATLAPVLDAVFERAALTPGERVLDIGCGAGTSTLEAARLVGATGKALGLDISHSLLQLARERAAGLANLGFLEADAQTYALDEAHYDCALSRFGVMFFDDTQAAFANIAQGLRPGGRIVMATWGAIPENPFFTLPARVAKEVIGPVPRTDPDLPGPFALRDIPKVVSFLEAAGFVGIEAEPCEVALTPKGNLRDVAEQYCQIGPATRALEHYGSGADDRARLVEALSEALGIYWQGDGVRVPAQINLFSASKAD